MSRCIYRHRGLHGANAHVIFIALRQDSGLSGHCCRLPLPSYQADTDSVESSSTSDESEDEMGSGSEDGDDKQDAEHGEDGNEASANGIDDDESMVRLAVIFRMVLT